MEVTDALYSNLDDGMICVGIYLDLQKAFDTVNHDILLHKLYNYGVRGVVHDWFKNYLANRQQFTQMDHIKSSTTKVPCGVPQGSVLGPLLFLIYVNDIGNAVPTQKVKLFADDTNLFIFGKGFSYIQVMSVDSINALNKWFVLNKLTLNLSKTCYMTFPSKNFGHVDIKVNNQSVSNVSNCKYLGIMLDDDLKWSEHIDNIFLQID